MKTTAALMAALRPPLRPVRLAPGKRTRTKLVMLKIRLHSRTALVSGARGVLGTSSMLKKRLFMLGGQGSRGKVSGRHVTLRSIVAGTNGTPKRGGPECAVGKWGSKAFVRRKRGQGRDLRCRPVFSEHFLQSDH